jgi:phenylalanyl-tRNA synthetase beta chain
LSEVVTHALVAPEEVERFGPLEYSRVPAGEASAGGPPVSVTNPLSRDHSVLRQSLLGGLLGAIDTNLRHGRADIALFEIGRGYARQATGGHEWTRLGFALTGAAGPPFWATPSRDRDLDDGKGILELLGRELGLADPSYESLTNDPNLHPGRAARVSFDTASGESGLVGRVGELHPALLESLDLRTERVIVAEVAVAGLSGGSPAPVRAVAPSRVPSVERDLAVVVADDVPAAAVAATIRDRAGGLLTDLRLFDVYRGAPLPDDRKSLAWRLTLQATDRTLTDAEVEAVVASVSQGLEDIGGRLRT